MKRNAKHALSLLIALVMLLNIGGIALAAEVTDLQDKTVSVTIDGKDVKLADANGEPVLPILVDGTTYLPVRSIAEALGLDVEWDSADREVQLSTAALGKDTAAEVPEITAIRAETRVDDYGQVVTGFELTFADSVQSMSIAPSNFAIENNRVHPLLSDTASGATSVEVFGDTLHVEVDPFLYAQGFRVTLVQNGKVAFSFDAADVTDISTEVVDEFEFHTTDNGLNYRLYAPASKKPLPLVIWFHGGGEGGDNNTTQLTANRGAVCFAEPAYQAKHPAVVMAPQSAESWSAGELDEIAAAAQALVDEGKVDGSRIYAVGLAAQQATLRFCASHRDLLAAALPIIYWKQFDEDWTPLEDLPMWVSIAENDFTHESPNMIEFAESMEAAGNKDIHCTIYTDAEMMTYGLFGGLTHWGWIPTINNAEMVDWLFSHTN